jgi:mannose-6-phosphate isomerase-like protein (cupin superfamily)
MAPRTEMPIELDSLPGSEESRRFEGAGYGAMISFFHVYGPPGSGPPLHRHPYEETFIIESGEVTFTVAGTEIAAGPGQIVIAPPDTPHKFVNSGADTLHLIGIHSAPQMEQENLE